jgi:uncharacterized protein (DUF2147 family)
MRNKSKLLFSLLALPLLAASTVAAAQSATSPIGRWKTWDDQTGKAMTITEVYEAKNGKLAARVVETLFAPNALCTKCSGDQKNKPMAGMPVLWNLEKTPEGWGNGQGFKPSAGESFKAKSVKLVDGGNKLEITGCKFVFCRSAHWTREK